MSTILFANNATSILAAPISNSATTLVLTSGTGALFPSPGAGQYFMVTLYDAATGLIDEIMTCTARSTDTLTVTRGSEGTSPRAWLAGDIVANLNTAGTMALATSAGVASNIIPATCTVGSNALTITVLANAIQFIPPSYPNGVPYVLTNSTSSVSVTIPSGGTLGTVAAQRTPLLVYAYDLGTGNWGIAVTNGYGLTESVNTNNVTAITSSSTSPNTLYGPTAGTGVASRLIGAIDVQEATPGTWVTLPTNINFDATAVALYLRGLGATQLYNDVHASRVQTTAYYNLTDEPFTVYVSAYSAAAANIVLTVTPVGGSAVVIGQVTSAAGVPAMISGLIKPGASYTITSSSTLTFTNWVEQS
jgi:hypothetical protein